MKALLNVVILQLMLQSNFSLKEKSNVHGAEFYYSGTFFPSMNDNTYFKYDLLSADKFDHIDLCLNLIDNLLDQFDILINKPK